MTTPRIRVSAVVFDPVLPSGLPINALYSDQTSQALSVKGGTGTTSPVGSSAASADSVLTKIWHNTSGFDIQPGRPVAKKPDGGIVDGAASARGTAVILGTSLDLIVNNAQGACRLYGPNSAGALTGMGFAPGDPVYLAAGGGYTNDVSTLPPDTDEIVQVGYADCAAGVASNVATDLIMTLEVVSFR